VGAVNFHKFMHHDASEDGLFHKALRRLVISVCGLLRLNGHVYDASIRHRVKWPNIPVRSQELYGQNGEDLIVASLLEARALSDGVDLGTERYLEIGGNHPFGTSATFLLHKRLKMRGILVEANANLIADLRKGRPDDVILHAAVQTMDVETAHLSISKLSEISSLNRDFVRNWAGGSVGEAAFVEVPAIRSGEIIRKYFDGKAPCFVSIDVEGLDLELLQDFDFNLYRPWIVQAEPSDSHFPGNTKKIIDHMRSVEYALVAMTGCNLIFRDLRGS
jgi:hypothetical protein